ncbi:MAG: DUF188 domain-containing protein [Spirochaetales bacterium]|nr:DUF188 domain-containing protein [Spirochaetales bacterium]
MRIFVDADSCPQIVRGIISRAAEREGLECVFAANRNIPLPENDFLKMVIVEEGEGVADQYIIDNSTEDDIAVTRDIPLAAELVENKVVVLNDRGEVFTPENIRQRLSIRNVMKDFRDSGIMPDADNSFGRKEIQLFANAFDRELRKLIIKTKAV